MRLCVETISKLKFNSFSLAAASVRLCVETYLYFIILLHIYAAASVRLCVETLVLIGDLTLTTSSRLRAAVC